MPDVKDSPSRNSSSWLAPSSKDQVWRNPVLLAVSLAVFATYAGIGMVGPVRVLYAQSRGASLWVIDAMASAYLISNFVFQYPVSWLADRWGRKQLMVAGLIIQALVALLYLPITDPVLFIVLRLLEGIGAAALLPAARALIIDAVPPEKQGEAYGIFSAFFNAGFLLGPGIGGVLANIGYTSVFVGSVVFRGIAILVVLFLIHTRQQSIAPSEQSTLSWRESTRALFSLPLIGAYVIALGDYLYLGFDMTLMPLWMHDHLGATVTTIGLAYMTWAIPSTLLSPVGGRVADHFRRSRLILIFGLAQVPLYIIYGLANMAILIVILFAVHSVVYAFIQPAVDAHVAHASASTMRARVQGMYATMGLIGAFAGATGFTPLYTLNFRLPLFTMGITYGLCVVVGATLIRLAEHRTLSTRSV